MPAHAPESRPADELGDVAEPTDGAEAHDRLPPWQEVVAIVAHPDDESFGLGALLWAFVAGGARVSLFCCTRGEASTLHGVAGDLGVFPARELREAATLLGSKPGHAGTGAVAPLGARRTLRACEVAAPARPVINVNHTVSPWADEGAPEAGGTRPWR